MPDLCYPRFFTFSFIIRYSIFSIQTALALFPFRLLPFAYYICLITFALT